MKIRFGLLILITMLTTSCTSTEYVMNTNKELTPAAEASVLVAEDIRNKDNLTLTLRINHLAQPSEIDEKASTYVAWIIPKEAKYDPINIGALDLQENLSGLLETTVAFKEFDIFVTPERVPTATFPTGPKVFKSHVKEDPSS